MQGRLPGIPQWPFGLALPKYSDGIVQDSHLFPFYPSAHARHVEGTAALYNFIKFYHNGAALVNAPYGDLKRREYTFAKSL